MSQEMQVNVVICDDEIWIRDMVEEIVKQMGLFAEKFENGRFALEYIQRNTDSIHLIISDIQMPEMTGLELLKFIDSNKYKIPVIFLTGSIDIKHYQFGFVHGQFEYLNKPIQPFELMEAIKKALSFGFQEFNFSEKFKKMLKNS